RQRLRGDARGRVNDASMVGWRCERPDGAGLLLVRDGFAPGRPVRPAPARGAPIAQPAAFRTRWCTWGAITTPKRTIVFALVFRCSIGALCGSQRSEEHTSELQSRENLVCRVLLDQ